MIDVDDDDDEPFFHVRYVRRDTTDNGDNYWEQYDRTSKSAYRLCAECVEKVCDASGVLCELHYNKENKPDQSTIYKGKQMKRKAKRQDRKIKKKSKEQIYPLETINEIEAEQIEQVANDSMNESLGIIISVSSSLNKKQIAQVKEFISKFQTDTQPIQFTCESQPDYVDDSTTHVISTDCGSFTATLTKQIVQACVQHIFVSSIHWITASLEHSSVLDHFPYEILRDKQSSSESRGIKQCRFDQLPVFPSSCVMSVECQSGIQSMKMTREELIDILELSGATLFHDHHPYQTLIILCSSRKDMLATKQRNDVDQPTATNERTVYYCKPEFLFHSIVRHEVQRIEDYCW